MNGFLLEATKGFFGGVIPGVMFLLLWVRMNGLERQIDLLVEMMGGNPGGKKKKA